MDRLREFKLLRDLTELTNRIEVSVAQRDRDEISEEEFQRELFKANEEVRKIFDEVLR